MSIWSLLSRLNKVLLPSIYTTPDLTRLSGFQKAIVGWKMYVTYRHLDALEGRDQSPLEDDKLRH